MGYPATDNGKAKVSLGQCNHGIPQNFFPFGKESHIPRWQCRHRHSCRRCHPRHQHTRGIQMHNRHWHNDVEPHPNCWGVLWKKNQPAALDWNHPQLKIPGLWKYWPPIKVAAQPPSPCPGGVICVPKEVGVAIGTTEAAVWPQGPQGHTKSMWCKALDSPIRTGWSGD